MWVVSRPSNCNVTLMKEVLIAILSVDCYAFKDTYTLERQRPASIPHKTRRYWYVFGMSVVQAEKILCVECVIVKYRTKTPLDKIRWHYYL